MTSTSNSEIECKTPADQQVYEWLIAGHTTADIRQAGAKKYPGENIDALIVSSLDKFADMASADTAVIRGWCLEAYRDLYKRMVAIGDYAGAIRAVKELARMAD